MLEERKRERSSMNQGTLLDVFRNALPSCTVVHRPDSRYIRIQYRANASLYFRTSENYNVARINLSYAGRFPEALQHYLREQRIPDDGRDYLIGPAHADRVIAILRAKP